MKKQVIILSTMIFLGIGTLAAQVCPPNTNSSSRWDRTSTYDNYYGSRYAGYSNVSTLQRLTHSFTSILNEGWRQGRLTDWEIRNLESDFRKVEREIRWAQADRNISFHERSMIDMYIRRLERNIDREWNDNDNRIG